MGPVQQIFRQCLLQPGKTVQKLLQVSASDRLVVIEVGQTLPGCNVIVQVILIVDRPAPAGQKSADLIGRKHLVLIILLQLWRAFQDHIIVHSIAVVGNLRFHFSIHLHCVPLTVDQRQSLTDTCAPS